MNECGGVPRISQIRRSKHLFFIILSFELILTTPYLLASPISVSLDHWSYQFIERLQAKGILKDFLSNIKPYSRDEMAKMIVYISNRLESGNIALSKVEKDQLDMMKREFASELAELGMIGIKEYKHFVNWSSNGKRFVVDTGYTQDVILKNGSEDYRTYKGILQVASYGDLEEGFFFCIDSRGSYTSSNESLPLWDPYRSFGYPWEGVADSYVIFRFRWADLQMGKDSVLWGPGYHGVIGLSGVNPTFDIIKLPIQMWKLKFVNILGFLRDNFTGNYNDSIGKYLSAHRIEFRPVSGICIGWQEAYVYAKGFQVELINPVMPYGMAHVYLHDIGNYATEGDIEFCILPNTRLYASLFLDDLHYLENYFTYAGNRWAVLGGVLIVDPFGIDNLDFRAEYARIEPWVYVHKGVIEKPPVPTSYKHFDTPLGHWIGPNADDLFFEVNHRFSKDLWATLSFSRIRKGEIGGSLYDYDASIVNGGKKRFLEGIIEKEHAIKIGLKYRIFQDSIIEVNYSYIKVHNKQKEEAKLPGNHPKKQPWKPGYDWSQNILRATVTLKL